MPDFDGVLSDDEKFNGELLSGELLAEFERGYQMFLDGHPQPLIRPGSMLELGWREAWVDHRPRSNLIITPW